jgi:membrane glycosyltransferase
LARRLRLFLTPAELTPDAVIRGYHRWHEQMQEVATTHGEQSRFVQVAADPYLQAVHLSLLEAREPGRRRRSRLKLLIDQMLEEGWGSLSDEERLALLSDQDSVQRLSALYWSRPVGPGLDHHPPG